MIGYLFSNIILSSIVYDRHEECPAWSAMGECKKSEWTWMVDNCPRSCEIARKYTIRNTSIAGKTPVKNTSYQ